MSGGTVTARFTVPNDRGPAGSAVAQVYVSAEGWPEPKRLAGFSKVALAPGRSRQVAVTIDPRLLANFDETGGCWRVNPGRYRFTLGGSSTDAAAAVSIQVPAGIKGTSGFCTG